jgi:N utilization substance protein A
MERTAALPRPELLQVAEAVARDKGIDRDEVIQAMESAIQKAGRSKYGHDYDIRATIDRKTGEIKLSRYVEVVEEVEDENTQMTLAEAQARDAGLQVGEFLIDPLPPIDFGRIAAQTAKQVIVQRVRDAERLRQFQEFENRTGEIVNGLVKRVEFGNVYVDLGRAEALLRRDELIQRETFRVGDRVRVYIMSVRQEPRGPQIFLSRTHPQFMAKLFAQEVPEIYDGIIEIKSVARDPGSRAKIAVISNDGSIDPVGACVGMRGSRVQAVVGELQGEKIDIIQWSQDPRPSSSTRSPGGGHQGGPRRGNQPHRGGGARRPAVAGDRPSRPERASGLAADRLGHRHLTEQEESERRQEEVKSRSKMFIEALDVDDVIAHLLVNEGFTSVEEVAYVPAQDLGDIEGFDDEIAVELQSRAQAFLEDRDRAASERRVELGVGDDLAALEGLSPVMLVKLGEKGVKTLDDLADLASDELIDIVGAGEMSEDEANAVIMAARAHWFSDEDAAETDDANP